LWAWGSNEYGQLGDGTTTSQLSPVQIGTDKWVSISNYAYSSLGIKQDGTLWAWGSNSTGQLGDGTTTQRLSPVQIGTDKWTSIASSSSHSLGIKQDGTLWGWGDNFSGQLGDGTSFNVGTNTKKLSPAQIGTDKWSSVSTTLDSSYGIQQDGTLWTWGGAFYRESSKSAALVPTKIGNDKWIKIATCGYNLGYLFPIIYQHALGIKQDGTLWAWGYNFYGQLGDGTTESADELSPVQIGTDNKWKQVSVSDRISQAIKEDGTLWVWGYNRNGQLGDGTNTNRYSPVQIGTEEWLTISSNTLPGGFEIQAKTYTVALKKNGTLWTWGNNETGQFGNGTTTSVNIPSRLGAAPPVLAKPALTVDFTNDSQPLLTTSGGAEYVWFKNEIMIDGAKNATYSVPAVDGEGTYTVAVEVRGCQSPLSNEVPIYITALDFEPEATVQLYPNPAHESLLVKVEAQAQLSVVSMNGGVQRISTEWLSNEQAHHVYIKDLISGMYILQIHQNGKRAQVKFIKQ
jgi:alpha-tubulin suppressor-like RCC1 family protein